MSVQYTSGGEGNIRARKEKLLKSEDVVSGRMWNDNGTGRNLPTFREDM